METAKSQKEEQQRQQFLQQQQMLVLQQIQLQKHQQQALYRFPSSSSSSSALLLHRRQQSSQIPNFYNPPILRIPPNPISNPNPSLLQLQPTKPPPPPPPPPPAASSGNQAAQLQMAYQDLWRVCHPDHTRHFSSLLDACDRLLPYHVVMDYEAEEDDRILDSDSTGQMLYHSQQWDHNIAAKVEEFSTTFEKQVFAFNIISRKRALGEFRSEERLMLEQILLQEERRALVDLRAEMDSRQKAGLEAHEANLRMAAMVHAEQARAETQAHAEMMARALIRANALGSQGTNIQIGHDMTDQEQEVNPEEMINVWGNNAQRDEKEPSEDFLNDEEPENGDDGMGEFDLNTR